jgi:hypothetical protein
MAIGPPSVRAAINGTDVFRAISPIIREGAQRAADLRGLTSIWGPAPLVPGVPATAVVFVSKAVMVRTANPLETFGRPDPVNPICGAPCEYNTTTGTAFWGFVSCWVSDGTGIGVGIGIAVAQGTGHTILVGSRQIPGGMLIIVSCQRVWRPWRRWRPWQSVM